MQQNLKVDHHFLENTVVYLHINYDFFSVSENCAGMILMDTVMKTQ